jgi:hypothetical protein
MNQPDECDPATSGASPGRFGPKFLAERRLGASGYLALRRIHCACEGGVLSLCGHLPSHYLKQVAQAIADGVEGVLQVDNQIRVLPGGAGRARPVDHRGRGPCGSEGDISRADRASRPH